MAKFVAIPLLDATNTECGIRYINIDEITCADYVNPTSQRLAGILKIVLTNGTELTLSDKTAEDVAMLILKHREYPVDQKPLSTN